MVGADERLAGFIQPVRAGVPVTDEQEWFPQPGFGRLENGVPKPALRYVCGCFVAEPAAMT